MFNFDYGIMSNRPYPITIKIDLMKQSGQNKRVSLVAAQIASHGKVDRESDIEGDEKGFSALSESEKEVLLYTIVAGNDIKMLKKIKLYDHAFSKIILNDQLEAAIINGSFEVAGILLEMGADTDPKNTTSPLGDLVQNITESYSSHNPLEKRAITTLVKDLILKKANVNSLLADGTNLLETLMPNHSPFCMEIAQILINEGAKVRSPNSDEIVIRRSSPIEIRNPANYQNYHDED